MTHCPRTHRPRPHRWPAGPTLKLLKVLNVLNVLKILNVMNLLKIPKDPSLACWALFLSIFLHPTPHLILPFLLSFLNYLTTDLQPGFDPVEGRRLEELGGLEGAEEIALLLRLGRFVLQRVEDVILEKLLIRDANLDRVAGRAMLAVPEFIAREAT